MVTWWGRDTPHPFMLEAVRELLLPPTSCSTQGEQALHPTWAAQWSQLCCLRCGRASPHVVGRAVPATPLSCRSVVG